MAVCRQKSQGFTLIEMAVVLAIIAVVMGSMLTLGSVKQEAGRAELTKARMEAIQEALILFVNLGGALPCPAVSDAPPGDAAFGIADDCTAGSPSDASIESVGAGVDTVWIGTVPTRTLNLPDSAMFDGWNRRITYAVVKNLATDQTAYDSYTTASTTGVIRIVDKNNNQIPTANTLNVIAYALISHGADGKGAYSDSGVLIACGAGTLDEENCERTNATFRDTRINNSDITASFYDDYVLWQERVALMPLPDVP